MDGQVVESDGTGPRYEAAPRLVIGMVLAMVVAVLVLGARDSTTAAGSLLVVPLTASQGGLYVDADVQPARVKTGDILSARVTARDSDGGVIRISVRWEGDGATVGGTSDCGAGTPRPRKPSVATEVSVHSYRQPGVMPIAVVVSTEYCPEWDLRPKTLQVDGKVAVAPGAVSSNGPLPLDLEAHVLDEEGTATTTALGVWVEERDGVIQAVEVDWGDGSDPEVFSTAPTRCFDPIKIWPASSFDRILRHDYPVGDHVARVTARSSGCDGLDEETRTVHVPVRSSRK